MSHDAKRLQERAEFNAKTTNRMLLETGELPTAAQLAEAAARREDDVATRHVASLNNAMRGGSYVATQHGVEQERAELPEGVLTAEEEDEKLLRLHEATVNGMRANNGLEPLPPGHANGPLLAARELQEQTKAWGDLRAEAKRTGKAVQTAQQQPRAMEFKSEFLGVPTIAPAGTEVGQFVEHTDGLYAFGRVVIPAEARVTDYAWVSWGDGTKHPVRVRIDRLLHARPNEVATAALARIRTTKDELANLQRIALEAFTKAVNGEG